GGQSMMRVFRVRPSANGNQTMNGSSQLVIDAVAGFAAPAVGVADYCVLGEEEGAANASLWAVVVDDEASTSGVMSLPLSGRHDATWEPVRVPPHSADAQATVIDDTGGRDPTGSLDDSVDVERDVDLAHVDERAASPRWHRRRILDILRP